jgi:hypothetical protein
VKVIIVESMMVNVMRNNYYNSQPQISLVKLLGAIWNTMDFARTVTVLLRGMFFAFVPTTCHTILTKRYPKSMRLGPTIIIKVAQIWQKKNHVHVIPGVIE